jgi:hypothetical protein
VLHSLSRRPLGLAWGPVKSVFLGAITFGILPLIVWPRKFARFVAFERQQLWHLVEWLRIRTGQDGTGEDEAAILRDSVRRAGATPTLWIVPLILLGILAANLIPWMNSPGFNPSVFFHGVYFNNGFAFDPYSLRHWNHPFRTNPMRLYGLWTLCLSVAYASHWLHVQQHTANVHRLLRRVNLIFARQNIPPVGLFSPGIGLRPFWILAALFGVACGAWWTIPASLAGAVHQRYVERTSTRIRAELAQRVSIMLQNQQPGINVPTPHGLRTLCPNTLCEKSAPAGAAFCPRCGSRIASHFNSGFGAVA